jgi:hypothetical protein
MRRAGSMRVAATRCTTRALCHARGSRTECACVVDTVVACTRDCAHCTIARRRARVAVDAVRIQRTARRVKARRASSRERPPAGRRPPEKAGIQTTRGRRAGVPIAWTPPGASVFPSVCPMPRVHAACYSRVGHTATPLADGIVEGARSVRFTEVDARRVGDLAALPAGRRRAAVAGSRVLGPSSSAPSWPPRAPRRCRCGGAGIRGAAS